MITEIVNTGRTVGGVLQVEVIEVLVQVEVLVQIEVLVQVEVLV